MIIDLYESRVCGTYIKTENLGWCCIVLADKLMNAYLVRVLSNDDLVIVEAVMVTDESITNPLKEPL